MDSNTIIIIPSRIGSTRLARKALLPIGDKSLIEHVVARMSSVAKGKVYVATDSEEIAKTVESAGAIALMTDENCPSGSDRVFEALQQIPEQDSIKYIINVQGDMPFVSTEVIDKIINELKNSDNDIVTPVVRISEDLAKSSSNVKVLIDRNNRAMYFSRSLVPHGASEFLYHVGIYGFRRQALEKFVSLEPSEYEKLEKLEQLRALEHSMKIGVCFADDIPISVDTQEDLDKAREYYAKMHSSNAKK